MIFDDFIRQGKVIRGEKDLQKAKALLKMSENNYKTAMGILLSDTSASSVFSLLYESLREIGEALCVQEGFKVYSHEALTAYFQKIQEEKAATIFDRYRKIRNGIHYYGKPASLEVVEEAKKQVLMLSKLLRERLEK